MIIPEVIKKKNVTLHFNKIYDNFVRYKSDKGFYECFSFYELGLITEQVKVERVGSRG